MLHADLTIRFGCIEAFFRGWIGLGWVGLRVKLRASDWIGLYCSEGNIYGVEFKQKVLYWTETSI